MSRIKKRFSDTPIDSYPKRPKLKLTSLDTIRKYLCSGKGEVIQALYMVFDCKLFSFETVQRNDLTCKFVTFLNLEGYSFIGYGNTKVSSRSSASRSALLHLLDDLNPISQNFQDDYPINVPLVTDSSLVANDLPDYIGSLVLNKYEELRGIFQQNLPWFKILSGIVMVHGDDYKSAKVIVVTTGSKCIEPKNIQKNGSVILDSHAEILSRRAFQYFLYSQIELYEKQEDSILQYNGKKYETVKDVSFYLFISSAPCGDCRIFAVSDRDNFIDKHPNRICRGVLRIKLDGGNSAVPITNHEADARLMLMSCSDKLLKMNVLGLQGSLLSHLVEPVYLSGLIIGDLFQQSHINRALYERIGENDFPPPFRLNKIPIYGTSNRMQLITKSPKLNVNWIYENSIEITNSHNGKTVAGNMSRLCKSKFFEKFLKLRNITGNELKQTYEYFKSSAADYQRTKNIFYELLENKNLGRWIRRNRIFNQFSSVY